MHAPSSSFAALRCEREEGAVTVLLRQNIREFLEVLNLICTSFLWPQIQVYKSTCLSIESLESFFSASVISFDVQKAF